MAGPHITVIGFYLTSNTKIFAVMDIIIHRIHTHNFHSLFTSFLNGLNPGQVSFEPIMDERDLVTANIQQNVASKLNDDQIEQLKAFKNLNP